MIESLPILIQPGGGVGARIANSIVSHTPVVIGSIDALSQSLTIGGTAYAPNAYIVADDINISTGAWASRHDVTKIAAVTGSGAAPTYGNYTAISNTAVKYAAAKYHTPPDTTWGQILDADYAFEAVISIPSISGTHYIASTTNNVSTERGWTLLSNGTSVIWYHSQTGSVASFSSGAVLADNSLVHVMVFGDRSEKMYMFANGAATGTPTDISTKTETMTGTPVRIGLYAGAGYYDGSIVHMGLWSLTGNPWPGAATNSSVMGAIAAERFAKISGLSCNRSTTFSFSRSSSAAVDRYVSSGVRQVFWSGPGWPRVCQRSGATGSAEYGYLAEPQGHNDFLYSEDMAQAGTWSTTRCSVGSNAVSAPDGATTADSIIADSANNTHYIDQATSSSSAEHIFSVWLKAGNKTWAELVVPIVAQAWAYFDIGNGAVGSKGSGAATSGIEAWGNGWYRCWFTYTGGAPSHSHRILPADSDGDDTFSGDGATASIYVWGAQHEDDGYVVPTSYIKTTTGAATRVKDSLSRTVSAVSTGKVTLSARFLDGPSHDSVLVKQIVSVEADDNNRIGISATTADVANSVVVAASSTTANITGSSDIINGQWHNVKVAAKSTLVTQSVDGTKEGTDDTSATMPTGLVSLKIGCALAALSGQPIALIRDIKLQKDVI